MTANAPKTFAPKTFALLTPPPPPWLFQERCAISARGGAFMTFGVFDRSGER